ncbi:hypothetical protein J7355_15435 [Endozoicomonas sp. G2_2]|nr:hypothetical protein [Endozoicomonas sp. G2_2]MBO9471481.1 hypothetical protein [Endozoicomonas sp. G2_2]
MKVFLTTFVIVTPIAYMVWSGADNPTVAAAITGLVVGAGMSVVYAQNP